MANLNSLFTLLSKIEKTNSIKAKIKIIESSPLKDELIHFIKPAIDPYFNFRVSEYTLPYCDEIHPVKMAEEEVEKMYYKFISDLQTKNLTPTESRARCIQLMEYGKSINERGCDWFRRIFTKNLRIGLHRENIQSIYNIKLKKFEVHLAVDTAGLTKHIEEFEKRPDDFIMEPKYDGLRMITLFEGHKPIFYTRNGRLLYNLGIIEKEISSQYSKLKNYVLDGEVYGKDWNTTTSIVRAMKTKKEDTSLIYYVFDIIPKDDWLKQRCDIPLIRRKHMLTERLTNTKHVKKVVWREAKNSETVMKFYREMRNKGLEGVMLKDLKAPYKFGRSKDWLKVKAVETLDVLCIDVIEGTGAARGKLGAIVVEYNNVKSKIGSGFTNKDREYYWKHKNEIVGHYVEIAYQEITKDGKIRFGRFIRVRPDK